MDVVNARSKVARSYNGEQVMILKSHNDLIARPCVAACCLILMSMFLTGCNTMTLQPDAINTEAMTNIDAYRVISSTVNEACTKTSTGEVSIFWTPQPEFMVQGDAEPIPFSSIINVSAWSIPGGSAACNGAPAFVHLNLNPDLSHPNKSFLFQSLADANNFTAAVYRITHPLNREANIPDVCISNQSRELPSSEDKARLLQAADAVRRKDYNYAVELYQQIQQSEPCWPGSYYNIAMLVAATYGDYADAIYGMGMYVQLAPNAPDVQAAKDKILVWQGREQEQQGTQ
jgi:hypothetical protein